MILFCLAFSFLLSACGAFVYLLLQMLLRFRGNTFLPHTCKTANTKHIIIYRAFGKLRVPTSGSVSQIGCFIDERNIDDYK